MLAQTTSNNTFLTKAVMASGLNGIRDQMPNGPSDVLRHLKRDALTITGFIADSVHQSVGNIAAVTFQAGTHDDIVLLQLTVEAQCAANALSIPVKLLQCSPSQPS